MTWQARLGVVIPADGIDDEFWKLAPQGLSVHITRIPIPTENISLQVIRKELSESSAIEVSAKVLMAVKPQAIAYACTSGSFVNGVGSDREISQRMEVLCGVPCTTTTTAAVKAFHALGANRLAIGTPYPEPVNQRLSSFMADNGFDVVSIKGMECRGDCFLQQSEFAYQLGKEADTLDAQVVFIACTALRTVDIIGRLERDLQKPVVSAAQATMWELLQLAGIDPIGKGVGSLFDSRY